ncbi:contractile injection system tape measure protein [Undibacterium cyanobacteriorum]|uniref:Contractile injection system tape measure protein n=1 Tax=Undibacterium cyanobacteriorum TaxID=3073561 RepID=A0ABY9RJR7_9BURK|nr:contractile injection system tape measure protein [Undibacterium sp. 20NA77.5]WMW80515.1 contractile injection system tape measure protein [Undibacterium sp. 20NA77.5]
MTAAHAKPVQHAIHALEVDLSIDGINDSVARDSGHYTDWVRRVFLPIVEEVVEQSAQEAGLTNHLHQRISKLEIDLGDIEADIADHEAARRLRAKLSDALMEQLRRHNRDTYSAANTKTEASLSVSETQQSEQEEALLNYLKSGQLDWQFANHPRFAHKRLLQETLLRANDQRLFEEIRQHPTQLLRLVRQFDEADRFQLLKKQLGAWSSNEREYLLDWLSLELTLHGDQLDYCEDLWLHVLSNLNTTNIERTLRTLALGFYASKNIRAQVRFAEYKNDIQRRANEQHFSVDYAQNLLSNLAHLFMIESGDAATAHFAFNQQDAAEFFLNNAALSPNETRRLSFIDTESVLEEFLAMIAAGDNEAMLDLVHRSDQFLLQHLKRLHQDRARIWQQNLSFNAKLALLQVLQAECAWIFTALASLDASPASSTLLAEIVDDALLQPVASLRAAALIDRIEAQYSTQLLEFTPFAQAVKDLHNADAKQILQHFKQLAHDAAGLASLRRLSHTQLGSLIEKLNLDQSINALTTLYPHQTSWVEAIIRSADAQTSHPNFVAFNTLWRIIRAAMNLSYGASLPHAVAHALLEIALHDSTQQASPIELTRKLFARLRAHGVLQMSSALKLQQKMSTALQASLQAWMDTEKMQDWVAVTQALTAEVDPTTITTTALKGSWLLSHYSEHALWVEHLVKNPRAAIQIYRHWQPAQRRELIQTLKPALRTSLIQALYPQQSLMVRELLQGLNDLKSLIDKAYGDSLLVRWNHTQIQHAIEDTLLGIAEGTISTSTLPQLLPIEVSTASMQNLLADLLSAVSDRPHAWWRTAINRLLTTPDHLAPSQAHQSDKLAVPAPPHSLTQQTRNLLPNLVNQLRLEQIRHEVEVEVAEIKAAATGQTHPVYTRYQAWLLGQTELSALDLSLSEAWQFFLWWQAAHPQHLASAEWNGLLSLYRLAYDLPAEANAGRNATRDLLVTLLSEIKVAQDQHGIEHVPLISESSLLAIEALNWRLQHLQDLQSTENDTSTFVAVKQSNTSTTLTRQVDLASLLGAQQVLASLHIDQAMFTVLADLDQLATRELNSNQARAILRLEQLLGLRRNLDANAKDLAPNLSAPSASLAQANESTEGLEKILATLIQVSSGTPSNTEASQISAEQYQELLNLWFQALGQADAALPFLRCIEFYGAQISDDASRARFTQLVLYELLLQRDIDVERLLEQANQEKSATVPATALNQPLQLGESTRLNSQAAAAIDLQEDAIPLALRQVQTMIASPAPSDLETSLQGNWEAVSNQLSKPALRAWLVHYLSEQLLSNLMQEANAISSTTKDQWRAILRRSLQQAQAAHLLLLLQLALHESTSARAQQLRRILRDEFAVTLDLSQQAGSMLGHLKQWSTKLRANFAIFSPTVVRVEDSNSDQDEAFAFTELAHQLYREDDSTHLSADISANVKADVKVAPSSTSSLPRSWHEHLPQILAEAMLGTNLAPLDSVWSVLVAQHGDDLRRAQRQYLRQAQQTRRLVEQNPQDKILDLITVNSPRFGHLVKLVIKAASVLQQGLPTQLDQARWQMEVLVFSYQASLQREFLAQTSAHQLLSLLRQQAHWSSTEQERAKETKLLRHIYYASLSHGDSYLSQQLAALLGERDCLDYVAPQTETLSATTDSLVTPHSFTEEQALVTDEEVLELLIANLGASSDIAKLIHELRDLNALRDSGGLPDEQSEVLKHPLRSHLSRRLWSTADLQNQERLWHSLARNVRAQARAAQSNQSAYSNPLLATEVEQLLPDLLDSPMVTQLAEMNFAQDLANSTPSTVSVSNTNTVTSTDTNADTSTSTTNNASTKTNTLAKLQSLLQSLSPLSANEKLWVRQMARRAMVQQGELLPQISTMLQQDHAIQRWCEALDTADLMYFLERSSAELMKDLKPLIPALRAHHSAAFETDGSAWSKDSLVSFYRLRFVLKQQDPALYLAQILRIQVAKASPEKLLEEFKTKLNEQERQMQLQAQRAREQERERQRRSLDEIKKRARLLGEAEELPYGESNVQNAGMVIIAPYIQRLFSILELTKNNAFVDEQAAERAVHLLQYVVTGESSTPEYQLALNKLLCGIHGGVPIVAGIDISEHEKTVIEQMLNGVISHWSALGKTSIAGLRQTFLVREGQLSYDEENWHLRIPTSTFDMLLDRLPWSFAMIRLPWMRAPLHVKWRASSE